MALLMNAFELKLLPRQSSFAAFGFRDPEEGVHLRQRLAADGHQPIQVRLSSGKYYVVASMQPEPDNSLAVEISNHRNLARWLAEAAVCSVAKTAGCSIQDRRTGSFEILRLAHTELDLPISVREGLGCRVWHDAPSKRLLLVANWRVRPAFRDTLDNPQLRQYAVGEWAVHIRTGKLAGRISSVTESHVVVDNRGQSENLPLTLVSLEPRGDLINRVFPHSAAARKVQQFAFSLTEEGRRNSRAVADRLSASQEFLETIFASEAAKASKAFDRFSVSVTTSPLSLANV